ncbi:MYND-type domain-containing protein [Mycena sanguinolenta]|uniref:phytol kinase n=1 Tax=Mycena sanguinolenta TaxID=230812 RepID=A0A8H7DHD2_9AGAR|nr:MYND-type domain-containing protein [Mycena sanguinolenta]
MHRLLRSEALSRLPISIRRFAIPAANGSPDDLAHLLDLVVDDEHRYTQCLPVLYANLDPDRIPDEEHLNANAVKCANFVLDSLADLEYAPKSTWPELWPRVWAWIAFFEAYSECLAEPLTRPHVRFDLLRFVRTFDDDDTTKEDINRTAGWRTLVMQAWLMILESEDSLEHYVFPDLCRAVGDMEITTEEEFEEVLDGAQGPNNLGCVVVQTIERLLVTNRPYISDSGLSFLTLILLFLENLGQHKTISPALMHNGGASVFTAAAGICHEVDHEYDRSAVQQKAVLLCLNALSSMLSCHSAMRDALASGLLHSILYCATFSPDKRLPSEMRGLEQILTRTLPGSTVFQTVLAELDTQLQGVRNTLESPSFQRCWMYKDWLKFMAFADDRIAFMKHVQSKDFVSSKACDNMECGVIRPKAEFKRCSHCQQVYYCCSDCQKLDWRAGGHRETCRSIPIFASKNKNLGMRNLHFMRQLLHRDLTEHRYSENSPLVASIRLRVLRNLAQTSESDPFVTVMDYGFPDGPILYMEAISWMEDFWSMSYPVYWEEHIARMTRSHGRMELHVMIIPEGFMFPGRWGPRTRHLMFPQRSQRPTLHESVRHLLKSGGSNVQKADIQQLLTVHDSIVRIH